MRSFASTDLNIHATAQTNNTKTAKGNVCDLMERGNLKSIVFSVISFPYDVLKSFQISCPNDQSNCYCPSVGDCEIDRYLVKFTNLVHHNTHQGDHHREYYITLTATNTASLSTTTVVDILLDESPPTVGVVWEGLSIDGQAEMDFTSNPVVHARWHGFQDHESGVLLYRVRLAERCMTGAEMENDTNITEVEHDTMTSFAFPSEGQW